MKKFIGKLRRHLPHPKVDGIERFLGVALGMFFLVFAILGIYGGEFLASAGFLLVSILAFTNIIEIV